MNWTSALAIYFIMWFLCLFLILPFHARRAEEGDGSSIPGEDKGAPARFDVRKAALQVTLLTALLFGLYYANWTQGWITRSDLSELLISIFISTPPEA